MIKVTTLGSAAMYATVERAASGYLVEINDFKLWMDCGGGTWQHLLHHLDYPDLDGVLLSHRHPDHTVDVFQAFHARLYGGRKVPSIPLWAPRETIQRLTAFSPELPDAFEIKQIEAGGIIDIAGAKVSFYEMAHPVETCGIRIENDGYVMAYTADTGPAGDIGSLARNADLFICEATFQDSDAPLWEGHLSASQAGAAARDAEVDHLVLTHLPAGRDLDVSMAQAQKEAGSITVELAEDRHTIEVER